jgi:hypothetical protein
MVDDATRGAIAGGKCVDRSPSWTVTLVQTRIDRIAFPRSVSSQILPGILSVETRSMIPAPGDFLSRTRSTSNETRFFVPYQNLTLYSVLIPS